MVANPLERSSSIRILVSLYESEKTFTQLMLDSRITSTTLSRRLKDFQKCELVNRMETKKGRGEVLYSLSKRGRKLFPELRKVLQSLKELGLE